MRGGGMKGLSVHPPCITAPSPEKLQMEGSRSCGHMLSGTSPAIAGCLPSSSYAQAHMTRLPHTMPSSPTPCSACPCASIIHIHPRAASMSLVPPPPDPVSHALPPLRPCPACPCPAGPAARLLSPAKRLCRVPPVHLAHLGGPGLHRTAGAALQEPGGTAALLAGVQPVGHGGGHSARGGLPAHRDAAVSA